MTILVLEKMTTAFAVDILKLSNSLIDKDQDNLADWLFYSCTQIGVKVARAKATFETENFISEMKDALSKANETVYWLEIIYENEFITTVRYEIFKYKCNQIRIELSKAIKIAKMMK